MQVKPSYVLCKQFATMLRKFGGFRCEFKVCQQECDKLEATVHGCPKKLPEVLPDRHSSPPRSGTCQSFFNLKSYNTNNRYTT